MGSENDIEKNIHVYVCPSDDSKKKGIFEEQYVVPLYQRPFSWGWPEIRQFIEDILLIPNERDQKNDCKTPFPFGVITVEKGENSNEYELVDGQQRLATLFLILAELDKLKKNDKAIKFQYREEITKFFEDLKAKKQGTDTEKGEKVQPWEVALQNVRDCIGQDWSYLKDLRNFKDLPTKEEDIRKRLQDNLKCISVIRVGAPKIQKIGDYFQKINNRGEPLQLHEIFKAKLLEKIPDSEKAVFSDIWEACSNMDTYVQYGFSTEKRKFEEKTGKETSNIDNKKNDRTTEKIKYEKKAGKETSNIDNDRSYLFGQNWDEYPSEEKIKDFIHQRKVHNDAPGGNNVQTSTLLRNVIKDAINTIDSEASSTDQKKEESSKKDFGTPTTSQEKEDVPKFEGIISFPHFLLHVLRVYKKEKKQLSGENVDEQSFVNDEVPTDKNDAIGFISCLLRCRFLLDKYVIKHTIEDNTKWELKKVAGKNKEVNLYTCTEENDCLQKNLIMLESCLRVSYTAPKNMKWIAQILLFLLSEKEKQIKGKEKAVEGENEEKLFLEGLKKELEVILKASAKKAFDSVVDLTDDGHNNLNDKFHLGTATPHILFNYLDYLLWKEKEEGYKDFRFTYRTSIEHWFPRHPNSECKDITEGEWIDSFGNLCLTTPSENSRLGNDCPKLKADRLVPNKTKKNLSMKLRKMIKITNDKKKWTPELCRDHGNDMLKKIFQSFKTDTSTQSLLEM